MIPCPYITNDAKIAFIKQCMKEGETDVRHLGRFLWYEFHCPTCGTKAVLFTPDYPYATPPLEYTCDTCADVMTICSYEPLLGAPKKVTWNEDIHA